MTSRAANRGLTREKLVTNEGLVRFAQAKLSCRSGKEFALRRLSLPAGGESLTQAVPFRRSGREGDAPRLGYRLRWQRERRGVFRLKERLRLGLVPARAVLWAR